MVTIHASMPPFGMRRRCTAPSLFKRAFDGIGSKSQVKQKEVGDESDCCDGPGCGNGRNETGGATRAAAIDKRRRRRGPCRSEERRVGKGCVGMCRFRGVPEH